MIRVAQSNADDDAISGLMKVGRRQGSPIFLQKLGSGWEHWEEVGDHHEKKFQAKSCSNKCFPSFPKQILNVIHLDHFVNTTLVPSLTNKRAKNVKMVFDLDLTNTEVVEAFEYY